LRQSLKHIRLAFKNGKFRFSVHATKEAYEERILPSEVMEEVMKCAVAGCSGEYKERLITQFFTRGGQAIVVEDIPAEVCDVCGDTLLAPGVVEQMVKIDVREKEPVKFAPVFKYKVMAGI